MNTLSQAWDFYRQNTDFVNEAFWGHVRLAATALCMAAATGIVRRHRLRQDRARHGVPGHLARQPRPHRARRSPSWAIVLTLTTIGFWPAVIGLYLLAVPPILLNTLTGVRQVDPAIVEASRGMGLTPLQVLTHVELPMAVPLISAGVRTAAVEVVATATLAGLVGGGGLGQVVISGLDTGQDDVLLAGAIPVALLALAAQLLFGAVERIATPRGLRIERSLAIQEGRTT